MVCLSRCVSPTVSPSPSLTVSLPPGSPTVSPPPRRPPPAPRAAPPPLAAGGARAPPPPPPSHYFDPSVGTSVLDPTDDGPFFARNNTPGARATDPAAVDAAVREEVARALLQEHKQQGEEFMVGVVGTLLIEKEGSDWFENLFEIEPRLNSSLMLPGGGGLRQPPHQRRHDPQCVHPPRGIGFLSPGADSHPPCTSSSNLVSALGCVFFPNP
jgi:hypothetical protein